MAEIVLFHHVLGRSPGIIALAHRFRAAGHAVHVPDLFAGKTFPSLAAGIAHAQAIGFDAVIARGAEAVKTLPPDLVYIGLSLGVLPTQFLAQTRPGARAAVLLHGCVPPTEFAPVWPSTLPVQIHAMDADPSFVEEGDIDNARALLSASSAAAMYLYPGSGHLFTDSGAPDYDAAATDLVMARLLNFLTAL